MDRAITPALLDWYADHSRDLPWRRTDDPYAIWVSEVMLQQTRVETVEPYYRRWMRRFPTIAELADAERDEVLNLWEGLGYYRRAVNLHRAARKVVDEHGGSLPRTQEQLRELPGIGDYTAAAVAAIAFGADAVALDGNLRRVLARLFDVATDVRSRETERKLRDHARQLLPSGQAAAFNQALMDLGATVCTPRSPSCPACPLEAHCLARSRGVEERRPKRIRRGELPHVDRASVVLCSGEQVLIARRPEGKLLGGLWEFPGWQLEADQEPLDGMASALKQDLGVDPLSPARLGTFRHSYTHYRVTAHVFRSEVGGGRPVVRAQNDLKWVPRDELDDYPMGKIDRRIAQTLQTEGST